MTSDQTRRAFLGRTAGLGMAAAAGTAFPALAQAISGSVRAGTWLPGELHCHSCYSHDVYCGPCDDNTNIDEVYAAGMTVRGKLREARRRGLRFCAVTDHNDVRSVDELARAPDGLIAIPAYENSLHGHAQMLGAIRLYEAGDEEADAVTAMAEELRGAGGLLQANHPALDMTRAETAACAGGCAECQGMHWEYGLDVRPDTIEVWNPTVARGQASEAYWESWLDCGERIAATGGSDSHWLLTLAVAGPGQPTTWVLVREQSAEGVLEGLRAGRTTIAAEPPALSGGLRLDLTGPDSIAVGDTVTPGTPLSVSADGLRAPAVVRVRANGDQILEEELRPRESLSFKAPPEAGWVWAQLVGRLPTPVPTTSLGDIYATRDGHRLMAMTSAIYIRRHRLGR